MGFHQSWHDYSMFVKQHSRVVIIFLVYSNQEEAIERVKITLHDLFKIKDLGAAKYFFGMEIWRTDRGNFLNQRKYELGPLETAGFLNCKPAATPMEIYVKVAQGDSELLEDNVIY